MKKGEEFGLEDLRTESWLNSQWRPLAAIVYLIICLFDFVIAPMVMGIRTPTLIQLIHEFGGIDPALAISIVQSRIPWEPLTLQGSGLFHISFGAILGVSAWTRGAAQIAKAKQGTDNESQTNNN